MLQQSKHESSSALCTISLATYKAFTDRMQANWLANFKSHTRRYLYIYVYRLRFAHVIFSLANDYIKFNYFSRVQTPNDCNISTAHRNATRTKITIRRKKGIMWRHKSPFGISVAQVSRERIYFYRVLIPFECRWRAAKEHRIAFACTRLTRFYRHSIASCLSSSVKENWNALVILIRLVAFSAVWVQIHIFPYSTMTPVWCQMKNVEKNKIFRKSVNCIATKISLTWMYFIFSDSSIFFTLGTIIDLDLRRGRNSQ